MAALQLLSDVHDDFLRCPVCRAQFTEPKFLPCLHRYCRDCVLTLLKDGPSLVCLECHQEHKLPAPGVDAFSTDSYTQSLIEFIALRKSAQQERKKQCVSCRVRSRASGHCFSCRGFLCEVCFRLHRVGSAFQEHRQHTSMPVSEIESKVITLEKVFSSQEPPKCDLHPAKVSELCCVTCERQLICIPCGQFGVHKGHKVNEITAFAAAEINKFEQKFHHSMKSKEKFCHKQAQFDDDEERKHTDRKQSQMKFDAKERRMKKSLEEKERTYKEQKKEISKTLRQTLKKRGQDYQKQLAQLKQEYETNFRKDRMDTAAKLKDRKAEHEKEMEVLHQQLEDMRRKVRDNPALLTKEQAEELKRENKLVEYFDGISKRFQNLITVSSIVLSARHAWMNIQCVHGLCDAIDQLTKDVDRRPPELGASADHSILTRMASIRKKGQVRFSKEAKATFYIGGFPREGWVVNSIMSLGSNIVVIEESMGENLSYLTIIDMLGRKQREYPSPNHSLYRNCAFISPFQFATGTRQGEIDVYDIMRGTCIKKNICDAISTPGPGVTCAAADPINKYIIIDGGRSGELYMFDIQGNFRWTMVLPEKMQWPRDISLLDDGNLLVSDDDGRRACAVSTLGSDHQLLCLYEFKKPGVTARYRGVRTDSHGLSYILWDWIEGSFLMQYNKDGILLRTKKLKENARGITTTRTPEEGELLMTVTGDGEIYKHGLLR